MHDLVMLQAVARVDQARPRCEPPGRSRCRPARAGARSGRDRGGRVIFAHVFDMDAAPDAPGVDQHEDHRRHRKAQPAACTILSVFAERNVKSTRPSVPRRDDHRHTPLPLTYRDDADEERADDHHARHRDTIGGSQRIRCRKIRTMRTTRPQASS